MAGVCPFSTYPTEVAIAPRVQKREEEEEEKLVIT